MSKSELSKAMQEVLRYYSEPLLSLPARRRGEAVRDRAFANDVVATAFDEVARQAYESGYAAGMKDAKSG